VGARLIGRFHGPLCRSLLQGTLATARDRADKVAAKCGLKVSDKVLTRRSWQELACDLTIVVKQFSYD
jgi:hypothetical protein